MKRRYGCLTLAALLFMSSAAVVHAEEYTGKDGWSAAFTGSAIESNFSSQSFADEVSSLQPGDSIEIKVAVKNRSEKDTDWYMSNEVLKSLEDKSPAQGGAYTYVLSWQGPEETRTLYSSDSVGGEAVTGAGEGLHEATDNLEDFFYLDHLEAGREGQVSLKVALNGETHVNAYQNTLARLQLNFAVEETGRGGGGGNGGSGGSGGGGQETAAFGSRVYSPGAVQTGDPGGMAFWSAAALLSGLALLIWGVVWQRKKSEGGQEYEQMP